MVRPLEDTEDRDADLREWMMSLPGNEVTNVDFMRCDDEDNPILIVEASRCDYGDAVVPGCRDGAWERLRDGAQLRRLLKLARPHRAQVWVLVYHRDLSDFWLRRVDKPSGWKHMSRAKFRRWIPKFPGVD